jgi:hypothetical protein
MEVKNDLPRCKTVSLVVYNRGLEQLEWLKTWLKSDPSNIFRETLERLYLEEYQTYREGEKQNAITK